MQTQEEMRGQVDLFNETHPIGAEVTYINDLGDPIPAKVRNRAFLFGGDTPVVYLHGVTESYELARVQ